MSAHDRPRIAGRHHYRNAAGDGPRRLGERETAARNDRIAQALRADVTIDLTEVDAAHLIVEHRALAAELRQLRSTVADQALELADLRSAVRAVLADGPDEWGTARARPYPQLTPSQAAAVERALRRRS